MSHLPKITVTNMSCVQNAKGKVLLQCIAMISVFLRGWISSITFEVMVLHLLLSRETSVNDTSPVMFVLITVYRPPRIRPYRIFLKNLVIFCPS